MAQPPPAQPFGFCAQVAPPPLAPTAAGKLITYASDGHLLTFAPTGSGKTAGPVICNALTHPGALIVIDIKGEVYDITAARRRAMGQAVHVIDLRDGKATDSLNPLDVAMLGNTDATAVARSLAAEMSEKTGEEREMFWTSWAETLIAAGLAHLLDDCAPADRHIAHYYDMLTTGDPVYSLAIALDHKTIRSRSAYSAIATFLALPDMTRGGILASAVAPLRLYDSTLMRRITNTTSIDLKGLMAGDPVTLYIIVPPDRLTAYRPLLRSWLSGLMLAFMKRTQVPKHRTLILADELGNLGKIDAVIPAFTLMRSAGVSLWGFLQNPAQLDIYGDQARTIMDNAAVIQMFSPRNRRMAAEYASIIGGDPDAIMRMGKDEQLLLIDGGEPRRSKRLLYFKDPEFAGLYTAPPGRSR